MTTANVRTDGAMTVRSADGTAIAYWTSGDGPPLLLVHGTTADHLRWTPLLPHLEGHAHVVVMDRRGRGASADAPAYDVAREFEDVAAVIDAVAGATGRRVDVVGHSFGAVCALGAVGLTREVRSLVVYEPPLDPDAFGLPCGLERRLADLFSEGRNEEGLEVFLREVVRMPEHELSRYRRLPVWPSRVAAAPTILRETAALATLDAEMAATIAVPTLLLLGGDSPSPFRAVTESVARALEGASITVLPGQRHIAMDLAPQAFARQVTDFCRSLDGGSG